MSYREALAWLFGTQKFGIKLGLENIQRLLDALQIPRNGDFKIADGDSPPRPGHGRLRESAAPCKIIHVAGTNGKGSVCAMIDSICRAQGYRTGLFTSPHLVTFRERIQVNGEMISEGDVSRGLTSIRELIRDWEPHPTFFEIATALGLLHFRERECEIVVLETGMGGRLDATNAITPVVSVITPIALDHQKWLGDTLAEIAAEKAGIIKPGVAVVSAAQDSEAEAVIWAAAKERRLPRRRVSAVDLAPRKAPLLEVIADSYTKGPVGLPGSHQRQNAALAVAALRVAEISVAESALQRGLAEVQWPARFQFWDERIVIDGAHNPAGARVLLQAWREAFANEQATLVFGLLRDKNSAALYRELSSLVKAVVLPQFRGERVLPPAALGRIISSVTPDVPCQLADSPAQAIGLARAQSGRILIAGSLHLAGEALAFLQDRPAAFEECAQ